MAAIYETEEEQVEALKKWWKENGLSIIAGIVIGLGVLLGWRWWQSYTDQQAQIASNIYEQVMFALDQKNISLARDAAGKLLSDYSGSPYAVLAVLNLARQDLEEGDIDSSHARLQWVIENSRLTELTHIARLRKVRLFLSQKKVTEANHLITGIDEGIFQPAYAELRGDIAIIQGQTEKARTAYTEAVASLDLSGEYREWLQIKRDDLGLKKEKPIEGHAPQFISIKNAEQEKTVTSPITQSTPSLTVDVSSQSTEVKDNTSTSLSGQE